MTLLLETETKETLKKEDKRLLIVPLTYFTLSDGFIILYAYSPNDFKQVDRIELAEVPNKGFFICFTNAKGDPAFGFSVEPLLDFVKNKKLNSLKISLFALTNYSEKALSLGGMEIPAERIYEIKGAVELLRNKL